MYSDLMHLHRVPDVVDTRPLLLKPELKPLVVVVGVLVPVGQVLVLLVVVDILDCW
jgi:hypothetical protein